MGYVSALQQGEEKICVVTVLTTILMSNAYLIWDSLNLTRHNTKMEFLNTGRNIECLAKRILDIP